MNKSPQYCPKCSHPLSFRKWSNRYPVRSRWREALADCNNGCGKFGLRYFDGKPTCDPYQIRTAAKKTRRGSWKLEPDREKAIIEIWGTVQAYLDNGNLLRHTEQYKS